MSMNIFEALRESHDVQRDLCTRVVRAKSGSAGKEEAFIGVEDRTRSACSGRGALLVLSHPDGTTTA